MSDLCYHCYWDISLHYAEGESDCDGKLHCDGCALECDGCRKWFCNEMHELKEDKDGLFFCSVCREERINGAK